MTMKYPGGKGACYQKYINLIPPHEVYIEPYLGGGAIMRYKRPAKINIGVEVNLDVITMWKKTQKIDFQLIHGDAISYLKEYPFQGNEFLYFDPPYVRETRRSQKKIYKYDYTLEQPSLNPLNEITY